MSPFKLRQSANLAVVKRHCGEQILNKSNQSNLQRYYLNELSKITREIVKKSGRGDYIYRGEPEHYDKVSSSLYNRYPNAFESSQFDIEDLQKGTLLEARDHIREHAKEEFEILTELQHFGSPTNLLDFTTDYLIALFFACDGAHDKDGRIILLKRTKEINEKYRIKEPQNPQNRVIAQKSIFVRPSTGYIDPQDIVTVTVPRNLKQWILIHLQKFQDISTQSIYNDIHGFIRHRNLRSSENAMYPLVFAERALENSAEKSQTIEERENQLRSAIKDFTTAIQYSPYDTTTYVDQGRCYLKLREYNLAIETFSKAIFLKPNYADAYFYRGWAYYCSGESDLAIADYNEVIELKSDYANAYHYRGIAYFKKGDYCRTIEDLTKAIELNSDDARAHFTRGIVQLNFEKWEEAKIDLTTAKNKGHDIIASFQKFFPHVREFTGRNGSNLPEDIAAMLTP